MSASSRAVDLRLALPVAVAWGSLGILLGVRGGPPVAALGLGVLAAALIAAMVAFRGRVRPRVFRLLPMAALACVAAAVLLLSAAVKSDERQPQFLLDAAGDGRFVTVEAVLTEGVRQGDGRFAATVEGATLGRDHVGVSVPVVIFGAIDQAEAGIGARVTVSGTLSATSPADSAAFLLFARGGAHVVSEPAGLLAAASGLRGGFLRVAEALPGEGGGLLPGLAIGDTSAVSPDLDAAMKRSSLSHLTAVSGDTKANRGASRIS